MSRYELTRFRRLLDQIVPRARPFFRSMFPSIGATLAVVGGIFALFHSIWMTRLSTGSTTLDPEAFGLMSGMVLGTLAFAIVNLLAFTALSVASMDALSGRGVDMGRAWRFSVRGRALWTVLLTLVICIISVMMCLVPALVVWPLLSLTLPVMVHEEKFGFEAIRRSAQLAWWNGTGRMADSNFLQISVLLFAGWLIQSAVSGLVQAPMAILQQYLLLREATGGEAAGQEAWLLPIWLQVPTQALSSLVTAAAWFFWTFGIGMLYFELERRRHAGDLRQAIEELTSLDSMPMTEPGVP